MTLEFTVPAPLVALRDEALALADAWTEDRGLPEDAWLIGHDAEFARVLGDRQWLAMTWPEEFGGHGRPALERFVVYEALISRGAPVAAAWFADRQIGPTLLQFGTREQCMRWLPDMAAGRSAWCLGMSEPDAGSDVASLRTRAVRDGRGWVVNGGKIWTSGAEHADWCYVVARTDPDAPKHHGLSELVVDMHAAGVEVRPITDMTGNRHFCEVRFEDVRVPEDALVGAENGSFRQLMRQLEHERGGIDRLVSNQRLFRDVLQSPYLRRDDPLVRQEVAAIESGYRIGRLLVLREVLGQGPPGFAAATKVFCTELEQRVARFCASALGPLATVWGLDYGLPGRVARNSCYAPAYTIMGGTSSVLRNVVGERMLALPR